MGKAPDFSPTKISIGDIDVGKSIGDIDVGKNTGDIGDIITGKTDLADFTTDTPNRPPPAPPVDAPTRPPPAPPVDAPTVDAPTVDAPTVDAPTVDVSKIEATPLEISEMSKAELNKLDMSKITPEQFDAIKNKGDLTKAQKWPDSVLKTMNVDDFYVLRNKMSKSQIDKVPEDTLVKSMKKADAIKAYNEANPTKKKRMLEVIKKNPALAAMFLVGISIGGYSAIKGQSILQTVGEVFKAVIEEAGPGGLGEEVIEELLVFFFGEWIRDYIEMFGGVFNLLGVVAFCIFVLPTLLQIIF
jgi:hypothetical protein